MPTTSLPDWLEPMAATLTQDRFTGPEWIFERKFDGIRLLAFKDGGDVRLFSRNRLPQQMPRVASAIAALSVHDAILDGERSAIGPNDLVFVRAGTRHDFVNTGDQPLRLITIYAPPEHAPGTVHATKADADAAEGH